MFRLVLATGMLIVASGTIARGGEALPLEDRAPARDAHKFVLAIRAGDVQETARSIDARTLAQRIYGDELKRDNEKALDEAYPRLALRIASMFNGSAVRAGVMEDHGGEIFRKDDMFVIDLKTKSPGGSVEVLSLLMASSSGGDSWRVVDFGAGGGKWYSEVAREQYRQHRDRNTPAQAMTLESQWGLDLDRQRREDEAALRRLATQPSSRPAHTRVTAATATEAAKAYLDMIRTGQAEQAFDTFWDLQRTASTVFGSRWDQADPPERERTLELLGQYLRPLLSTIPPPNEPAVRTMKAVETAAAGALRAAAGEASVADFKDRTRADDSVDVTYTLSVAGRTNSPRLCLYRSPDGWKIFDVHSGGQSVVEAMSAAWRRQPQDLIGPVEFVRVLQDEVRIVREATGRKSN